MADTGEEIVVVVIDDHDMFTAGLVRSLCEEPDLAIAGVAATGQAGIALVDEVRPDVALVDYVLPDLDGIAVTSAIKGRVPSTMVLMLTGVADDRVALAAIEAGCSGFLTKDQSMADVAPAVRAAAAGERLFSPSLLGRLLPRLRRSDESLPELTDRELDVLRALARGLTNRVIATELHLSVNTVRNYVQGILVKLGAHAKLEAVAIAVRAGLIDYGEP
jgi:DNA-binding NarL/FixJ family response regulator